ncbi:hypothetical protein WICPIJ_006299 [Wickerhamomyces pijperi]|uniref:RING-type domain-containing protein n=1 Tax=Wickerhamomyces pijperi TaxID=599730 RepID=A0A9P8TKC1_WICPI|nr:hypothetical protein WICPIJ_006299 [Wickerhamomyces pijperi]
MSFEQGEDCTICLDTLFPSLSATTGSASSSTAPTAIKSKITTTVTRLQPCKHHYHSQCIHLWTQKSNTCPTCRNDYETIQLVNSQNEVIHSKKAIKITDVPIVEEFFEENLEMRDYDPSAADGYDVDYDDDDDASVLDHRLDFMLSNSNTCVLCDDVMNSALTFTNNRTNSMTCCVGCSSSFHLNCLGLSRSANSSASTSTYWCCPFCDADNRIRTRNATGSNNSSSSRSNSNSNGLSMFRRSRNSARTNRVYNSNRRNLEEIIQRANEMQHEREQEEQQQQRLLMDHEGDINVPEIEYAWDAFEIARKDVVERNTEAPTDSLLAEEDLQISSSSASSSSASSSSDSTISHAETGQQRKFKKPSTRRNRLNQQETTAVQASSSSNDSAVNTASLPSSNGIRQTSVVSSILTQMKSNRNKQQPQYFPTLIQLPSASTSTSTTNTIPSSNSSASSPTSPSSIDSVSSFSSSSPTPPSTAAQTPSLSYDQKQNLRNIVRDVLKPYYLSKSITEDQYTYINRKLSHFLYDLSLTHGGREIIQRDDEKGLEYVRNLVMEEIRKIG